MSSTAPKRLVWVTGSHGLVGAELLRCAGEVVPSFTVRGISRETIDLLDSRAVADLFRRERPSLVVHCAALSRNPVCQAEPALAHRVNVGMTQQLAELASDVPFVLFSTDLIFDGEKGSYLEGDAPNPLSVYGETKALAEELVRKHASHLIIRLSLTGGRSRSGTRAFNEEMKNAWREGKALTLFTDEFRCPSSADVIARATWELVRQDARGTFHLCFPERLSRHEMGLALAAKHPDLNPKIVASSRLEYRGAPRPRDTSINNSKAQALLSFRLPGFTEWLHQDTSGF